MKRSWEAGDDRSTKKARYDESDYESMDEDEDMDDEEAANVRQMAYEKHLPTVKRMLGNERPNLLKDQKDRACSVCKTCKYYKGWKALMSHAGTFKQKKPQQHRGLLRALEEVITPNAVSGPTKVELATTRVSSVVQESQPIVWPPILQFESGQVGLSVSEVLGTGVLEDVVVTEEKMQLVQLKDLPVSLTAVHKLEESMKKQSINNTLKKHSLIVLTPQDMIRVDPQHRTGWYITTQNEVVKRHKEKSRDAEIMNNHMRADKLKHSIMDEQNEELRFSKIMLEKAAQETHLKLEQLLQESKVLEESRTKTFQEENRRYEYQMNRLQDEFAQAELRMKKALERSSEKNVKEKFMMQEQNEHLQRRLAEGSQRAQGISHRCQKLMKTKEALDMKLKEEHKGEEEKYRMEETDIIALHEKNLQKLEEDFEKYKEDILSGKEKPQVETTEYNPQECVVCKDEFGDEPSKLKKRAMLKCLHVGLCEKCGNAMFENKHGCPICRTPIDSKPIALHYKIFMD